MIRPAGSWFVNERGALFLDLVLAVAGGVFAGTVTTMVFTQGGAIAGGITVGEGLVFAITSIGVTATIFLWKRQDGMQKEWNVRHDTMQKDWHDAQVAMAAQIGGLTRGEEDTQRQLGELREDISGMGSKVVNQIYGRYDHRFDSIENRQAAFDERVRDLEARRSKGDE